MKERDREARKEKTPVRKPEGEMLVHSSQVQKRRTGNSMDRPMVNRLTVPQKSPSDTTIYRPALCKGKDEANEVINKITNFVESIRLGTTSRQHTPDLNEGRKFQREKPATPSTLGKEEAQRITIDADQLKVNLPAPKGKIIEPTCNPIQELEKLIHNLDDDDEFFHVSCHVGTSMKAKIA